MERYEAIAASFDAPVDSRDHWLLRETASAGGDLIEGRYLLGVLIGENLFRVSDDEYLRRLRAFIVARISQSAADVFCQLPDCAQLIPYLRYLYHTETAHPSMPSRRDRREKAFAYLLHNLDASDSEIAAAVGTTEKQVQRMAELRYARRTVHISRGTFGME